MRGVVILSLTWMAVVQASPQVADDRVADSGSFTDAFQFDFESDNGIKINQVQNRNGKATWDTENAKIWSTGSCTLMELGEMSLEPCQIKCDEDVTCEAINYKYMTSTPSNCVLVQCLGPIHDPTEQEIGYIGYKLLNRGQVKAPTSCDLDDWVYAGPKLGCVLFVTSEKSWQDARTHCQSFGGTADLVILDTTEKRVEMALLAESLPCHYWVGGKRSNGWNNGNPISNGWAPGTPKWKGSGCLHIATVHTKGPNMLMDYFCQPTWCSICQGKVL